MFTSQIIPIAKHISGYGLAHVNGLQIIPEYGVLYEIMYQVIPSETFGWDMFRLFYKIRLLLTPTLCGMMLCIHLPRLNLPYLKIYYTVCFEHWAVQLLDYLSGGSRISRSRGRLPHRRGRQLPMHLHFENFVCQNKKWDP